MSVSDKVMEFVDMNLDQVDGEKDKEDAAVNVGALTRTDLRVSIKSLIEYYTDPSESEIKMCDLENQVELILKTNQKKI